jgi:hypothetical protein
MLGGDVARLLECASKEVALSASPLALLTATRQHTWIALVRLAMNLGIVALSLPPPQRTWHEKSVGGDGANLVVDGPTSGLGRLALTRVERGVELV